MRHRNTRAVLRKSACATRKQGPARKLFSRRAMPWCMRSPCSRCASDGCVAECIVRIARESKQHETSVFLFLLNAGARIARPDCSVHACACRVVGKTRPRPGRKKDCVRLLTVEKTVIRFRHSRRCLRNQVSRRIETTRSTTRTSARTIDTVDAGSLSPAKTSAAKTSPAKVAPAKSQRHPEYQTRSARRRGFFVAGAARRECRIRTGARRAPAVDRGSDSRDVALNWAVLAKQVH